MHEQTIQKSIHNPSNFHDARRRDINTNWSRIPIENIKYLAFVSHIIAFNFISSEQDL